MSKDCVAPWVGPLKPATSKRQRRRTASWTTTPSSAYATSCYPRVCVWPAHASGKPANEPLAPSLGAYSAECVEGVFPEVGLPLNGVLGSPLYFSTHSSIFIYRLLQPVG